MGASGVTKPKDIEKLLNRFGQTISDLPIDELGIAYREHFLDDVINRMEIALQTASDRIDEIRETTLCIAEEYRPWATQYAFGCVKTCEQIINLIDGYPEYEDEQK